MKSPLDADALAHARAVSQMDVEADTSGVPRWSPPNASRGELWQTASENQSSQARRMQQRVAERTGGATFEVGDVVRVAVAFDDKPKLQGTGMNLVVLHRQEKGDHKNLAYTLGRPEGYVGRKYDRSSFVGVTMGRKKAVARAEDLGLEEALTRFRAKTLPMMSQRALIGKQSISGVQGHGYCNCRKGQCNTTACKCFRAGVTCRSGCHKGNNRCLNDRQTWRQTSAPEWKPDK